MPVGNPPKSDDQSQTSIIARFVEDPTERFAMLTPLIEWLLAIDVGAHDRTRASAERRATVVILETPSAEAANQLATALRRLGEKIDTASPSDLLGHLYRVHGERFFKPQIEVQAAIDRSFVLQDLPTLQIREIRARLPTDPLRLAAVFGEAGVFTYLELLFPSPLVDLVHRLSRAWDGGVAAPADLKTLRDVYRDTFIGGRIVDAHVVAKIPDCSEKQLKSALRDLHSLFGNITFEKSRAEAQSVPAPLVDSSAPLTTEQKITISFSKRNNVTVAETTADVRTETVGNVRTLVALALLGRTKPEFKPADFCNLYFGQFGKTAPQRFAECIKRCNLQDYRAGEGLYSFPDIHFALGDLKESDLKKFLQTRWTDEVTKAHGLL